MSYYFPLISPRNEFTFFQENGNIDRKTLRFSRQIFPVKNYYNNVPY